MVNIKVNGLHREGNINEIAVSLISHMMTIYQEMCMYGSAHYLVEGDAVNLVGVIWDGFRWRKTIAEKNNVVLSA